MTNNEEEVIIPIDQITDFPNHPYKVKNDETPQRRDTDHDKCQAGGKPVDRLCSNAL